jgi:hypothetical protein
MQNQVIKVMAPERLGAKMQKSNCACVYMNMTQVSDVAPAPVVFFTVINRVLLSRPRFLFL